MAKISKKSKKVFIYSINFFYYYIAYDETFLNWYYNQIPSFYLHPKTIKAAVIKTLHKVVENAGMPTEWNNTIQYHEAKYVVYYRIYKIKGKYSDKKRDLTRKGMPYFLRVALEDGEDVYSALKDLKLVTKYNKTFKKQIKANKPIKPYELYKFFVKNIVKKYKFKLIPKMKIKGFHRYKI